MKKQPYALFTNTILPLLLTLLYAFCALLLIYLCTLFLRSFQEKQKINTYLAIASLQTTLQQNNREDAIHIVHAEGEDQLFVQNSASTEVCIFCQQGFLYENTALIGKATNSPDLSQPITQIQTFSVEEKSHLLVLHLVDSAGEIHTFSISLIDSEVTS